MFRPAVRNVYILLDYGTFINGTTDTNEPFVQLLSTTDPAQAHLDFVNVRGAGQIRSAPTPTGGASLASAAPLCSKQNRMGGVLAIFVPVFLCLYFC